MTVNLCKCILSRYPSLHVMEERQLPPGLEMRRAAFLVWSPAPWGPECDCTFAVLHIQEPLGAIELQHGEASHHKREMAMVHADTGAAARASFDRLVEGLPFDDWLREFGA